MSIIQNTNDFDARLRWMFKLYDQNDDGYIDKFEFEAAIKVFKL